MALCLTFLKCQSAFWGHCAEKHKKTSGFEYRLLYYKLDSFRLWK